MFFGLSPLGVSPVKIITYKMVFGLLHGLHHGYTYTYAFVYVNSLHIAFPNL